MIFSRIIYSAILVGLVGGGLLTSLQVFSLNPIIFAAEGYQMDVAESATESSAETGDDGHSDHGHGHGDEAWIPANGLERTAYTLFANILASTGFAAMLLALMCQFCLQRKPDINWFQGSLWGLAGFTALFLAPAIAMPPEIPGMVAAAVEYRQIWWVLCALSVAFGLGIFAFSPVRMKALGLLFLVIPYIVGAPQVSAPMFNHSDPSVVQVLDDLQQRFVVSSAIANLVFWLFVGLACRFAFNRWLRSVPITAH